MIKPFVLFLAEAKKHATTGHLDHVEALLYQDPDLALKHFDNTVSRFRGAPGTISLKADGGTSVKIGRLPNGTHVVGYKTGEWFNSHDQIEDHARQNDAPHYARIFGPLLDNARSMRGLKKGHAIQADIIYQANQPDTSDTVVQPNTIRYGVKKGHSLVLAAHSQYRVNSSGELKKVSSSPDIGMLRSPGVHAPKLAIDDNVSLSLTPERNTEITSLLSKSKKSITPELRKFASSISTLHPKFTKFFGEYHSHASRTTGQRSVSSMREYVDMFMKKKAQSTQSPVTQQKNRDSIEGIIKTHEASFGEMFRIHNDLIRAKHHVLDQFRTHADQFDLETDRGEEHEGIVSDVDGHQAKFVREGPDGFPKKNADNLRFGSREA